MVKKLSHYDGAGRARMVDVSAKAPTRREAEASAFVAMTSAVLAALPQNPKGNPLEVARIAGIMAAKRTSELIPMCHPLPLALVDVDVTLCENGAKPGFERTAAVKITEEGAFAASAIGEAVELGEERVGEFASFGGSRAAAEDGGCGGAKVWAIGGDEMLPGRFAIFHASGGERQILEMEGGEIFVKFLSREASTSQALLGASLQRRREMVRRKTPIGTIRLRIKGLEPGWAGHNSLRSASAAGGLPGLGAVCGVFLHLFR